VVLEFPEAFWSDSADFFGAALPGGPDTRGACFMFWNLARISGKPVLAALVSGAAALVRACLWVLPWAVMRYKWINPWVLLVSCCLWVSPCEVLPLSSPRSRQSSLAWQGCGALPA
jgi:hypothetical protein